MDSQPHFVIPLAAVTQSDESLVGAKSARLGALAKAGHPVAPGFCVTVDGYLGIVSVGPPDFDLELADRK